MDEGHKAEGIEGIDATSLLDEARREELSTEVAPHPPAIALGTLAEHDDAGWLVKVAGSPRGPVRARVDDSVDPAILDDASERGARVLLDWNAGDPIIVGVVTTQRAVTVDRDGALRVDAKTVAIDAEDKLLIRIPGAFVQLKGREIEVYGDRVLTRARELAKTLAGMISFN